MKTKAEQRAALEARKQDAARVARDEPGLKYWVDDCWISREELELRWARERVDEPSSTRLPLYSVRFVRDGWINTLVQTVSDSESAFALFRKVLRGLPHEEMWVAMINARHVPRGLVRVSQGGAHGCSITPSDVLRPVLLSGCSSFIIAHNHPSGNPTPSADDARFTAALREACRITGLTLLDHLVVCEHRYQVVQ